MANNDCKRVTWVRRSVLDYRIPVFKALDEALGGGLSLVYSRDHTPARVRDKLSGTLGERAIGLAGEKTMGSSISGGFANRGVSLVYQPGVLKPNWYLSIFFCSLFNISNALSTGFILLRYFSMT